MSAEWKEKYEALIQKLDAMGVDGIYPMGHLSREGRERIAKKRSDDYKCGWNDAAMKCSESICKLAEQAEAGANDDATMLIASDCAFQRADGTLTLNMNDTWGWALAWCPEVPPEEVEEVARLFRTYGRAGLLYWHSRKEGDMKSEFHDVNRMVEFVRHEERIREETPESNKRAYRKVRYTVGIEDDVGAARALAGSKETAR